jgi:hypothetical protein
LSEESRAIDALVVKNKGIIIVNTALIAKIIYDFQPARAGHREILKISAATKENDFGAGFWMHALFSTTKTKRNERCINGRTRNV